MLKMIFKDLRISPLRNILTSISMLVGIIAMIGSFLVGTLGKDYLISVNAQMYGWTPTYSYSITDTIRIEETNGQKRYFVAFIDGQGIFRESEVSYEVYTQFCRFVKCERNLRRSDERHLEQSELTEETLCRRALHKPKPVDEAVNDKIRSEQLERAIMELPEVQRRRFRLYFDYGLTYEQIGKIEGCSKMPVKRSIDRAIEKIREKIKYF